MDQTIFCVVGMHRSGSSLFANWLHDSGLFIGYNLYGAESSNKKGHFEDLDFLNLHKEDLKIKGHDISGLFTSNTTFSLDDNLINKAKNIIKNRGSIPIWGWKEPRTTLYLNFWKEQIPNLKIIVLVRPENEVINSLYNRLKKNKWYYTNNPVKKIYWWYDISLKPRKWKNIFRQTYKQYYKACTDFSTKHPKDSLIINTNDFISDYISVSREVNSFLNTNIEFVDMYSIFDSSLLSKKNK